MMEFITYEQFGAIGDGLTNDFFAIKAAHDYANEHSLKVKGTKEKTYRISHTLKDMKPMSITVMTSLDLCGADIIIDHTDITPTDPSVHTPIFIVKSRYMPTEVDNSHIKRINEAGAIDKESIKRIDTGLNFPAMLIVYNKNARNYIRYGSPGHNGQIQKELIIVDKYGNIDDSTPFLFDYDEVTSITALRIDEEPLTIENGRIITLASKVNLIDKYVAMDRQIRISRPNTVIKDIVHEVRGEYAKGEIVDGVPFIGYSYSGILDIMNAHNVLIENFTFQARTYYKAGTYDIHITMSNAITFRDCKQSNFFSGDHPEYPQHPNLDRCWGVCGSNFCKNLVYENCSITRYDAHAGVYNGRISNCEIASIRLTGGGNMLIENTKIYSYIPAFLPMGLISLREDFGVTWRGNITVKDCEVVDVYRDGRFADIITAGSPNWYYGYKTYFPNVTIDNLKIENAKKQINLVNDYYSLPELLPYFYRSVKDPLIADENARYPDGEINKNPYTPPDFLRVINNEENGYEVLLWDVPLFEETKTEGIRKIK